MTRLLGTTPYRLREMGRRMGVYPKAKPPPKVEPAQRLWKTRDVLRAVWGPDVVP